MAGKSTLYDDKLIVANCSGFFGDRFEAAKEMVQGGPVDFLTGDYLAELTMAILFRKQLKNPDGGYAGSFLQQMEGIMGECLDNNIRVVANAGGLNPKALALKLEEIAQTLGLQPKIAFIEGDNLIGRIEELQEKGEAFTHLDKGISLASASAQTISANAYLGGWGVAAALEKGADIVVGGRIADAALAMGPPAWKFNWKKDDWNALAGAAVAGHIIECSCQATGGNYSLVDEVPSYSNMGFPIAEIHRDGSCVITKHEDTGGLVSVGTVTAQLLYEVRSPAYLTPDVTARFDTIEISQQGADRVSIRGVQGEPPPPTTKVCINNMGGYRNSMTLLVAGLDVEKKAAIVENALFEAVGGKDQFQQVDIQLIRFDKEDPPTTEEASAHLKISVLDPDPEKVGRSFANKVVQLALANIPGFTGTSPPGIGTMTIVHWPTLVSAVHVPQTVVLGDKTLTIEFAEPDSPPPVVKPVTLSDGEVPGGKTIKAPLGRICAARSGDKGGNANLGVWGKTTEAYRFLKSELTVKRLKKLLPDMAGYEIERYELPNLKALNFFIIGVLGDGVAASVKNDPQAKTLGEYLRAKTVNIPVSLLEQ